MESDAESDDLTSRKAGTGVAGLDDLLDGGFARRRLYLLEGNPGTGKTTIARQMSVYDVWQLGEKFDLVIFMGVFYHLRHPLLALDLIHEHVASDLMLFQSMQRGEDETIKLGQQCPVGGEVEDIARAGPSPARAGA